MVKCPKCGIEGWEYYYPVVTIDTDFDDDIMIEINKVECTECHHRYFVKEFYKLSLMKVRNID